MTSLAAKWTDSGKYDISWYNDFSDSFELSTPRQFAGLIYLCNSGKTLNGKTIIIINDMDFSENDWVPMDLFEGVIDGNYHKFTGLHVNHSNSTLGPNYFSFGLMSVLGGTVKAMDIDLSFIVYSHGYESIWVSGVCKTNNGLIKDCIVRGTVSALNTGDGVALEYDNSASAFACENNGSVVNCINFANITSTPYYYSYKAQAYAGGIVSINNGNILNCINHGNVFSRVGYDSTRWKIGWGIITHAYSGGIAGINSGVISNVLNLGNATVSIVKLGNMDGTNGSAGNIVSSNTGTVNYAYCSSSNTVEAPNIVNEGSTLDYGQIHNQSYQFSNLLNQNVDNLSNEDICYWGNAPSKEDNLPLMLNGFILQTQIIDAQQNVATFTAIPADIVSSVITSKGFEYKRSNDSYYKKAYATNGFSSTVSDLDLSEKYIVRAFVTLSNGKTIYFQNASFVTSGIQVETKEASDITAKSAIIKGKISTGNIALKSQGFLWKEETASNYNVVYSEGQDYQCLLEGLTPNTMYLYQAFVLTQNDESVYGEQLNFVTLPITVSLTEPVIDRNSIVLKGQVNLNEVTELFVEYKKATESQYTKTSIQSYLNGNFECLIENLLPNTYYDFRAYIVYKNTYIYSQTQTYKTLNVDVRTLPAIVDASVLLRGETDGGSPLGKVGFEYRDARHPNIIPSMVVESDIHQGTFNAYALNILNGIEYKYRAYYKEETNDVYGEWVSFIPTNIPESSLLSPINSTYTMNTDILANVALENIIIDSFYYNFDQTTGNKYDTDENCIIIVQPTEMAQIINKGPGSEEIKNKYNGIIMKIRKGAGSITINTQTSGTAKLVVQKGNSSGISYSILGKGDVVVGYDISEDTYVYIYTTINNSNAPGNNRVSPINTVKIFGIKVQPGVTALTSIERSSKSDDCYYTLDGLKLNSKPTKKGIYIVNGQKFVVK